jgi:hypothetical protein
VGTPGAAPTREDGAGGALDAGRAPEVGGGAADGPVDPDDGPAAGGTLVGADAADAVEGAPGTAAEVDADRVGVLETE